MATQIKINGVLIPYDPKELLHIVVTSDDGKPAEMGPIKVELLRKTYITGNEQQGYAFYGLWAPPNWKPEDGPYLTLTGGPATADGWRESPATSWPCE